MTYQDIAPEINTIKHPKCFIAKACGKSNDCPLYGNPIKITA